MEHNEWHVRAMLGMIFDITEKLKIKMHEINEVLRKCGKIPVPIDCTEELTEVFRKILFDIDQKTIELNKCFQLIEGIELQKRQNHPVSKKLQILYIQGCLMRGRIDLFMQREELFKKLDEPIQKKFEQRCQRNEALLQECKQMADAEDELAILFDEPELNQEEEQQIRLLQQKRQKHDRRLKEYDEKRNQIAEQQFFRTMIEENSESHELDDDQKELPAQNLEQFDDILRQQKIQMMDVDSRLEQNSRVFEQRQRIAFQQQSQSEVNLQPPQSRPMIKLSALSCDQHDDLVIYKIFNDRQLKKKLRRELPIRNIVQFMPVLTRKFIKEINEIESEIGNYAAVKKCFQSFAVRKVKPGWSYQLLQSIKLNFEHLEDSLTPNKNDMADFLKRSGVPRNSLVELISCQLRKVGDCLLTPMGKNYCEDDKAPIVHPELGLISQQNEVKTELISFQDIIESTEFPNEALTRLRNTHAISLFLVGTPGSGKSTMAKRMVKTYNEDNKIAFFIPLQSVDQNQPWSLKNLLLKFPLLLKGNEGPSANKIERDFELVRANQDKCLIVFDGLDEVEFQITDPPVEADINDELCLRELLSLILSRRFLPGARVITACRPHTLTQLVTSIQPDAVVIMGEFTESGFEKLFRHYIRSENLQNLLETLERKSPQIYRLIHTPLFLHLFVMLHRESDERIWSISTTAKLFSETIKIQQDSANFARQDMVEDLNLKLGRIAYKKTMNGSVLFEEEDLDGLSADDVQDFMFSFMRKASNQDNSSLVKLFGFHHLSVQEYLTAEFALMHLSVYQFKDFLRKIFPRVFRGELEYLDKFLSKRSKGSLKIGEDEFANVRMLTIGCINEMDVYAKQQMFMQCLYTHLRQIFGTEISSEVEDHQLAIMKNLMDFRKDNLLAEIREELKTFDFWFGEIHFKTNVSMRKEFLYFVGNFVSNIKCFRERTENFKNVSDLMHSFTGKVEEVVVKVEVDSKRVASMPHVGDIVGIFPKLTRKLIFELCDSNPELGYKDVWEVQRGFWTKLNKEIQKFDTNTLQTEILELYFRSNQRVFLCCALRREEIPATLFVNILSRDETTYRRFRIR